MGNAHVSPGAGPAPRTGWGSWLGRLAMAVLVFESISGLAVTFAAFHPVVQWGLLLHTVIGCATLLPLAWYYGVHWADYRHYTMSHVVLLGYVGLAGLLVCTLSGVVVTAQGLFALRTSPLWRQVHLISTFVALGASLPHVLFVVVHMGRKQERAASPARRYAWQTAVLTVVACAAVGGLSYVYRGESYVNEFPADYQLTYGEDRPFAPSLARTESGGAFDSRSLAGSESCGTAGCHEQIVEEWGPSAHRYAAMDVLFQGIQSVMAEQNGPESTRYCGGCHDPISLFSGTKNLFVENLTEQRGYQEGVSCLVCHGIHETDLRGNANYVISQSRPYLWQWKDAGAGRVLRDFLIRTYPAEHNKLSKRMYKKPEYCAACHKQFIDQELNRVGWVQLQNQYDNWAASMWNDEDGDPRKTVECRECHMPLVDSRDPASGDPSDYNRTPRDGKHRSHRFIAANRLMPKMLELEGWEEQDRLTEEWLRGEFTIPEIEHKWARGPIVQVAIEAPDAVRHGDTIPLRVILTSNKVGHDFPTGPLDIIQSWIEVRVTDTAGNTIFRSGTTDEKHFIEPGSFLFKAEPVDQYGNLIDRHNLWEMVGVRYKRALFPGYSDTVEYEVACPSGLSSGPAGEGDPTQRAFDVPAPSAAGEYHVRVALRYRKVDQFLLNFLLGEDAGVTSPVTELASATAKIRVEPSVQAAGATEPLARTAAVLR